MRVDVRLREIRQQCIERGVIVGDEDVIPEPLEHRDPLSATGEIVRFGGGFGVLVTFGMLVCLHEQLLAQRLLLPLRLEFASPDGRPHAFDAEPGVAPQVAQAEHLEAQWFGSLLDLLEVALHPEARFHVDVDRVYIGEHQRQSPRHFTDLPDGGHERAQALQRHPIDVVDTVARSRTPVGDESDRGAAVQALADHPRDRLSPGWVGAVELTLAEPCFDLCRERSRQNRAERADGNLARRPLREVAHEHDTVRQLEGGDV